MSAADLWTAVKDRYDEQTLRSLTNVRKRDNTGINDSYGTLASQAVIDLFPVYVQAAYDPTSGTHLEVAVIGTLAMLWRRSGVADDAVKAAWDDWMAAADGLKAVEPRGHAQPETNSSLQGAPQECRTQPCYPWASKRMFWGLIPRRPAPHGPYGGPDEWI